MNRTALNLPVEIVSFFLFYCPGFDLSKISVQLSICANSSHVKMQIVLFVYVVPMSGHQRTLYTADPYDEWCIDHDAFW
jgi:hypothetical protein